MSKYIKTDHGRPVETSKDANWKRRQRRKRLKARRSPEFKADWANRSSTGREVSGPARSVFQFHQADFHLDVSDQLRHAGPVSLDVRVPCRTQIDLEACFVGVDGHLQALGPGPDEHICARADDLFEVSREFVGQAISQINEESKQADPSRASTSPVRFFEWNSQLGVGDQVELVVHLVADGDRRAPDQFSIGRSQIVRDERPFAVFVERQSQAGHAAAPGAGTKALKAYGLELFNRLFGSMHSALLSLEDAEAASWFQGRAA